MTILELGNEMLTAGIEDIQLSYKNRHFLVSITARNFTIGVILQSFTQLEAVLLDLCEVARVISYGWPMGWEGPGFIRNV